MKKSLFLILTIFTLLACFLLARQIFNPSMIMVVGQGKVEYTPDKVQLIVTRLDESPLATDSIRAGNESTQALLQVTKSVAGEDVTTKRAFSQTQPVTNMQGGRNYQTVNGFSITSNKPEIIEDLVTALYRAGATGVTNITFGSNQEESLTMEAKKDAIKDAKDNAKQMAKASGKRLGRLISITDDATGVDSSTTAENSVDTGFSRVSITKNVMLTYAIW